MRHQTREAYIYTIDDAGNLAGAPLKDGRLLSPLAGAGLSSGGFSEAANLASLDNFLYFVDAAGNLIAREIRDDGHGWKSDSVLRNSRYKGTVALAAAPGYLYHLSDDGSIGCTPIHGNTVGEVRFVGNVEDDINHTNPHNLAATSDHIYVIDKGGNVRGYRINNGTSVNPLQPGHILVADVFGNGGYSKTVAITAWQGYFWSLDNDGNLYTAQIDQSSGRPTGRTEAHVNREILVDVRPLLSIDAPHYTEVPDPPMPQPNPQPRPDPVKIKTFVRDPLVGPPSHSGDIVALKLTLSRPVDELTRVTFDVTWESEGNPSVEKPRDIYMVRGQSEAYSSSSATVEHPYTVEVEVTATLDNGEGEHASTSFVVNN